MEVLMPRRTERIGMTLEEKAKFHANGVYSVPLRTYKTVDKFTFVFVPITLGNKPNPTKIKVTHIGTAEDRYEIQYVMVERKLKSKKIQRVIIDVRPIWIEGKVYEYYNVKEGYIEAYGESETINNNPKISKWMQ
ncbi:MAG TPA: hypothetical protein EYM55_00680 [Candidatus Marinimicrobia bacterium]|nr:hypothetical protein [Candidatus Neomarinimicrobiota bacterium]